MKAISYLTIVVIAVAVGSVVAPFGTHADTPRPATTDTARLINLLAVDEIVSIRSSDGRYDIDLLNDATVRSFHNDVDQLKKKIESASTENKQSVDDADSQRKRIEMIESGWYNLTSPWRIVHVGEDYVRLEPIAQLPRHEEVSWIAVSQSSIRQIKSKKQ
jgi:hypothetical protein